MRAARTAVLAVCALALALPGSEASAAPIDPLLAAARLAGNFQLAGRITTAVRIKGERKGQTVLRNWSFLPACSVGACRTVGLLRKRASGSDKVTLTRKRPGYYTGSGSFYVALRCGGKLYQRGELARFTVSVTVTAAQRDRTGTIVATRVNATYSNRQRRNLTPCVDFPGHDAASYHGHVLVGSSSGGSSLGG